MWSHRHYSGRRALCIAWDEGGVRYIDAPAQLDAGKARR